MAQRLALPDPTTAVEVHVDGLKIQAYQGETIATLLMLTKGPILFENRPPFSPSRLYCGMGVCVQCLVTVNKVQGVRACQKYVEPGMRIRTRP
jgi:succinate dehydrogenase/fumarate reductase-like Fe-S protein